MCLPWHLRRRRRTTGCFPWSWCRSGGWGRIRFLTPGNGWERDKKVYKLLWRLRRGSQTQTSSRTAACAHRHPCCHPTDCPRGSLSGFFERWGSQGWRLPACAVWASVSSSWSSWSRRSGRSRILAIWTDCFIICFWSADTPAGCHGTEDTSYVLFDTPKMLFCSCPYLPLWARLPHVPSDCSGITGQGSTLVIG